MVCLPAERADRLVCSSPIRMARINCLVSAQTKNPRRKKCQSSIAAEWGKQVITNANHVGTLAPCLLPVLLSSLQAVIFVEPH